MGTWAATDLAEIVQTAELVVDVIRGQIERGQLRPGQRLPPERELAARLGVSRPSVRTGLRTLATMGIVHTRHGAGTFVTDGPPRLDVRPLRMLAALHGLHPEHLEETRRLLEMAAAALAAERAVPDQLAPMAEQVSGMFASVEDPQAFALHDARFHRSVASAGGNPILEAIVEMVTRLFLEQSRALESRSAEDLRAQAMLHRNIYHAIRSRDIERARREMGQHLGRARGDAGRVAGAAS